MSDARMLAVRPTVRLLTGNALTRLRDVSDGAVQCVVTSPPYWGLRDYGIDGQIGMESAPEAYVQNLVALFREVRRVLRDDGTMWLNLGDSYAGSGKGANPNGKQGTNTGTQFDSPTSGMVPMGLKAKDLVGIPWRVAFALQADGWYLRSDIVWAKPNPMPESMMDRPTRSHEYIFLLTKSQTYYYDAEAVKEPAVEVDWQSRYDRSTPDQKRFPTDKVNGIRGRGGKTAFRGQGQTRAAGGRANREGRAMTNIGTGSTRNRRDVWTVATTPYRGAHLATFPPALIEPCIKAGCGEGGGVVLDPFGGAGTTGLVAARLGRDALLVELNPEYVTLARHRIEAECGLLTTVTVE